MRVFFVIIFILTMIGCSYAEIIESNGQIQKTAIETKVLYSYNAEHFEDQIDNDIAEYTQQKNALEAKISELQALKAELTQYRDEHPTTGNNK